MLIQSFLSNQDYQSMVKLVEDLEKLPNIKINEALGIQQLYAFALNRYSMFFGNELIYCCGHCVDTALKVM